MMKKKDKLALWKTRIESCKNSGQKVIDWCAEKLAKFKVPGFVKFKEDFPRTSIGKVQKNILKKEETDLMTNN